MLDEQEARQIVAHRAPGLSGPVAVTPGPHGALVSANGEAWLVREIERGRNFERGPGYRLYEIESAVNGALERVAAVAILPDKRSFLLTTPEGMRAFYGAVHGVVSPTELASLLAWYQSTAEGEESIILDREELVERLMPSDLAWLPEVTGPTATTEPDGTWRLQFYGLYLSRDPAQTFRFNLNAWRVTIDAAGRVQWSSRPVARRLRSPRYEP